MGDKFEIIKELSSSTVTGTLKRISSKHGQNKEKPAAIIIDGTANNSMINAAEDLGVRVIAARNFTTTDTEIELISF